MRPHINIDLYKLKMRKLSLYNVLLQLWNFDEKDHQLLNNAKIESSYSSFLGIINISIRIGIIFSFVESARHYLEDVEGSPLLSSRYPFFYFLVSFTLRKVLFSLPTDPNLEAAKSFID